MVDLVVGRAGALDAGEDDHDQTTLVDIDIIFYDDHHDVCDDHHDYDDVYRVIFVTVIKILPGWVRSLASPSMTSSLSSSPVSG